MSTGVIFILDKGVSPILASGVRSTLAPGVIRAWVFQFAAPLTNSLYFHIFYIIFSVF